MARSAATKPSSYIAAVGFVFLAMTNRFEDTPWLALWGRQPKVLPASLNLASNVISAGLVAAWLVDAPTPSRAKWATFRRG